MFAVDGGISPCVPRNSGYLSRIDIFHACSLRSLKRDQGAPVDASVVWSDFLIFIPSLCACVHQGDDWRDVFL